MLKVYHVQPAAREQAAWLRQLIEPALLVCKAQASPLEIGPTGLWAGWANTSASSLDGRVRLSSQLVLWSKARLLKTYLHELAHRLRGGEAGHDAAFFTINLCLLQRLDAAGHLRGQVAAAWSLDMGMYDLQDPPAALCMEPERVWKPKALTWCLHQAQLLSASDLDAEALAAEVVRRYTAWDGALADEQTVMEATFGTDMATLQRDANSQLETAEIARQRAVALMFQARERARNMMLMAVCTSLVLLLVLVRP